jgi:hypothetical protein
MNETIYFVDTNILFNLADSIFVEKDKLMGYQRRTQDFWQQFGKNVRIPSIILAEFHGLWFHKNVDLENYELWYRDRFSAYEQLIKKLKEYQTMIWPDGLISLEKMTSISRYLTKKQMPTDLINDVLFRIHGSINDINKKLNDDLSNNKESLKKALNRHTRNLKSGKLLDGLDSVLAAHTYAHAKENPGKNFIIISDDEFIVDVIRYFAKNQVEKFYDLTIPQNVQALTLYNCLYKRR